MDKTNLRLLKSILPLFGVLFGGGLVIATIRYLALGVLTSGIYGATVLALLTLVVGVILGIVILRLSFGSFAKVWSNKTETN